MDQNKLIRILVLSEISDDYENFQKIAGEVAKFAARCGLFTASSPVLSALAELIDGGMAKAYRLSSSKPPEELPRLPVLEAVKDAFCYFMITAKGREFLSLNEKDWPFDEEGNLREDRPPWIPCTEA